jgi:hypothetical protein
MKFATDDWKISLSIFKVGTDSTTKPTELLKGTKLQLKFLVGVAYLRTLIGSDILWYK